MKFHFIIAGGYWDRQVRGAIYQNVKPFPATGKVYHVDEYIYILNLRRIICIFCLAICESRATLNKPEYEKTTHGVTKTPTHWKRKKK